jgi:nucleotide-binding universal stress UspA family protein
MAASERRRTAAAPGVRVEDDPGMGFELGRDGPTVIMAGLDGSPTSWHAVAYAAGLARRQRSRLLVVHVAAVPALATLAPVADVAIEESLAAAADELRDELESRREWHELNGEFRVERGDVYTGLCRVAEAEKVDAVVVGSSAQAGHRLIGSLAVRLVKAGRWPVTVVP